MSRTNFNLISELSTKKVLKAQSLDIFLRGWAEGVRMEGIEYKIDKR